MAPLITELEAKVNVGVLIATRMPFTPPPSPPRPSVDETTKRAERRPSGGSAVSIGYLSRSGPRAGCDRMKQWPFWSSRVAFERNASARRTRPMRQPHAPNWCVPETRRRSRGPFAPRTSTSGWRSCASENRRRFPGGASHARPSANVVPMGAHQRTLEFPHLLTDLADCLFLQLTDPLARQIVFVANFLQR